ncbi:hypothetical protein [uncultured Ruminococcus sp.]|uniref:hypothetical protein n=1 Tax=uncultured Ruminococcus sp. TaxID=165186 RepID=UPI00345BD1A3
MLFLSPFSKYLYDLALYFKQTVLCASLNQVTKTNDISCILKIVSGIEIDVPTQWHTAVLLAAICNYEANCRHDRTLIICNSFLRHIYLRNSVLHFRVMSLDVIHGNSGKSFMNISALPAVFF